MKTLKQIQSESQHSTDKDLSSHTFCGRSYLDCYDELLPDIRYIAGNVLEIGVLFGGSLLLWRDYFPSETKIIGLDIDPTRKEYELSDKGVHVEIGSQVDTSFLISVIQKYGPFKFILDDGSHVLEHMLQSFKALWSSLVHGGIYAMEDMRISYQGVDSGWPGMKYNEEISHPNDRTKFNEWILNRIKAMDHHEGDVRRVTFHPMIVSLTKA